MARQPPVIVFLSADLDCIGFGWLSGHLLQRGWSTNRSSKITMLLCAFCASSVIFIPLASNYWVVIALVSTAVAALQSFSANLFTLPTDLLPESLMVSAMGFGGTFGAIGGIGAAMLAGFILQATGNYISLFMMASSVGFLALLRIHLLSPSFAPLEAGHKTGEHE